MRTLILLSLFAVVSCEQEPVRKIPPVQEMPTTDSGIVEVSIDAANGMPDTSSLDAAMLPPDSGLPAEDAGTMPECVTHEDCSDSELCESGSCIACATTPDCNGNGLSDYCDIQRERSSDCDNNQNPDECDLSSERSLDCNQNQILDECEFIDDGCTIYGRNDYIEYITKNIPVIITAPHGGTLQPTEIPARQGGTQVRDTNTTELARSFYYRMRERANRQPHVILVHLHRTRLDANRAIGEATEGHPHAEQAWREYHRFIEAAKRTAIAHFGSGLYLDFHKLRASRTKIELRYLLTGGQLEIPDSRMRHPGYAHFSNIRSLAPNSPKSFEQLLQKPNNFGTMLTNQGYDTIPNTQFPDPGTDAYYRGGYNTGRHGSINSKLINGLQIEHVWEGVRDTLDNHAAYNRALAAIVESYLLKHFGIAMRGRSRVEPIADFLEITEDGLPRVLRFHRHGVLSERVELELQYAGTATLNEDLTALPSSIAFEVGHDTAEFEITALDDSDIEGPDTVEVRIATSTSYNLVRSKGTFNRTTTIIIHDDERPSIDLNLSATGLSEPAETRRIRVSAIPPEYSGEVQLELTGTAQPEIDYSIIPPEQIANARINVQIPAQAPDAYVDLQIQDDSVSEGIESIVFQPVATSEFVPSPRLPLKVFVYDDDLDPALIQWWPGEIREGLLVNRLFLGDEPPVLPNTLEGPQPISGPGATNPALRFDGDDDIVFSPDINTATASNFSLSFWFRFSELPTNAYGYLYSHSTSGASQYLHVYLSSSGTLRTAIRGSDDETAYSALDVPQSLSADQWHHYALVVRSSTTGPNSSVYLNGAEESSAPRGGPELDPPGMVSIGGRYDLSSTRHFAGDLSQFRIYNRALRETEIQALSSP